MDWRTDPTRETPPSRQIVERALDAIASGELASAEALPSVRKMAATALLNHNTVARAYRDLESLGVVRGENGRGVFVTDDGPRLAREERRAATWAALVRAWDEALRAGHELDELRHLLASDPKTTLHQRKTA